MIEEARDLDSVFLAFFSHLSLFFSAFSSHSSSFFAFFFLFFFKSALHFLNLLPESFFEHSILHNLVAFSKAFLQELACFSELSSFLASYLPLVLLLDVEDFLEVDAFASAFSVFLQSDYLRRGDLNAFQELAFLT